MQSEAVTVQIEAFLKKQFPLTRKVGRNDALLENGLLDSLGILEIVSFLEQEFQITIADEELLPENFQSIACLATFVQNKCNDMVA